MKERLRELVSAAAMPRQRPLVVREYLQARILEGLQRQGAMIPLAFQGGTALRLLYHLPRFSEDLDFALEGDRAAYDLRRWMLAIVRSFEREGYELDGRVRERRAVQVAWLRFRGVLHELGLSGHRDQALSIKIDVDTRPPAGAGLEVTVVRRHVLLRLQHHDRASLYAGKLHALLARAPAKGRDLYDVFWYAADPSWPEPNVTLLANALRQTDWRGPLPSAATWREIVCQRLTELRWQDLVADVRPFLSESAEADLLDRDDLRRLLRCRP